MSMVAYKIIVDGVGTYGCVDDSALDTMFLQSKVHADCVQLYTSNVNFKLQKSYIRPKIKCDICSKDIRMGQDVIEVVIQHSKFGTIKTENLTKPLHICDSCSKEVKFFKGPVNTTIWRDIEKEQENQTNKDTEKEQQYNYYDLD